MAASPSGSPRHLRQACTVPLRGRPRPDRCPARRHRRLLERNYPGDDGTRQPVHTVYVPADRFTPGRSPRTGAPRRSPRRTPTAGWTACARCWARMPTLAGAVAPRVAAKLAASRSRTSGWTSRTATGTGATTPRTPTPSPRRPPWPPPSPPAPPRRSSASASSASRRRPGARGLRTLDLFVSQPGRAPASSRTDSSSPCPRSPRWPRWRPWTTPCPGSRTVHSLPAGRLALRGPGGNAAADPGPGRHVPGGAAAARRPGPDQRAALRHLRLLRVPADFRGIPVHGTPGGGLRQGSHAARRGRHRHPALRRLHQHHPGGRRTWRTPGGCTAGWSAARWSAATTRAGTCTRPSCRAASPPPTPSTGRASPAAAARLRNYVDQVPTAASWTNPPPPARWPPSCCAASSAARVGAEEVLALAGVGLPELTALAHPRLATTVHSLSSKEPPMSNVLLPPRAACRRRPTSSPTAPWSRRPTRSSPRACMRDIVTSNLPGWTNTRSWIIARPIVRLCHDVLAADRRGRARAAAPTSPSPRPASKASSS